MIFHQFDIINIRSSQMQSESSSLILPLNRQFFSNISFFAKQFCMPKQIKLVDWEINTVEGRQIQNNIQIVDRNFLHDSNPVIRDIIDSPLDAQTVDPGDGLISVSKYLGIKVAICITVYTQDKTMLKRTLEGVRKNYEIFNKKAGIHSHQIAIIVIFDGIDRINMQKESDKNMSGLFRQFDLVNGFRKKQYLLEKQKQGLVQSMNQSSHNMIEIENFGDEMVYTQKQYEQLEEVLFETQYKQYKEMSDLIEFGEEIQSKKLNGMSISELPFQVLKAMVVRTRKFLQQNGVYAISDDDNQILQYIQESLPQDKVELFKLQALKDSVLMAKQYLKTRQNTAILYQLGIPMDEANQWQPDARMYIYCVVKHANRGKISSHLWFFQGFCNMINPDVCILLDCGLQPSFDAIFKMWSYIDTFKQTCGGVCGYMKLRPQNPYDQSGNRPESESQTLLTTFFSHIIDIQKAQIFQYHFSHLLDKPFEGLTGYIHVLPGAFSGYNWQALKSQKFKITRSDGKTYEKQIQKRAKKQILKKYLKTVVYNEVLDNIGEANMFLAEDRVLCLEIYTRKKHAYNLQYLPNSQAKVDPLTTLSKLISQRKRWINGSWFALDYVLKNKNRVWQSDHNCWQKLLFHFNMFNADIMRGVSYISVSLFFVTFHMTVSQFAQTILLNYFKVAYSLSEDELVNAKIFRQFFALRSVISSFTAVFDFLLLTAISRLIYLSITLKKQDISSKKSFNNISTWLGIFGILFIVLIIANVGEALIWGDKEASSSIFKLKGQFTQRTFIYLLAGIVGSHAIVIISSFSFSTYFQIISALPSYFFYTPSYINIFLPFAFCRIDDLSWGTKGLDSQVKAKQKTIRENFTNQKIKFLLKWLGINVLLALVLSCLANDFSIQNYIIWIFSAYFAGIMAIKTLFVVIYHLRFYTIKLYQVSQHVKQIRKSNQRFSVLDKNSFNQYMQRVKEKIIDEHIQMINNDIIIKNMAQKALKSRQKRIKGLGLNNIIESQIQVKEHALQMEDIQQFGESKMAGKRFSKLNSQQLKQSQRYQQAHQNRLNLRDQIIETEQQFYFQRKLSFRQLQKLSQSGKWFTKQQRGQQ